MPGTRTPQPRPAGTGRAEKDRALFRIGGEVGGVSDWTAVKGFADVHHVSVIDDKLKYTNNMSAVCL